MPDSEDEAYDPWPGCVMTETGCHYASTYYKKQRMPKHLTDFFGLESDKEYQIHVLEHKIIEYAKAHNGIERLKFNYDETLWNLLERPHSQKMCYYHLSDLIHMAIRKYGV